MLKVVGASGFQTLISFLILLGILIFGILLIIVCRQQNSEDDGKYAATVKWSPETEKYVIELLGQNNDPKDIHLGIARAYYQPNMHRTGWAILEIESNHEYPDEEQAFASGILEGSLSWKHIYWQWKNTVENSCKDRNQFCETLYSFLEKNKERVRKKAKARDKIDSFWHQVNLFYIQLDGIEFGWQYEARKNGVSFDIPSIDFLWLNIVSDLKDFEKLNSPKEKIYDHSPMAMSLLKVTSPEEAEFLLAHASSGFSMLRIQKKYTFNFHNTGDHHSELVPARTISFTSYPGSIHSQDDFYQIHMSDGSKVTITGTALLTVNYNNQDKTEHSQVLLGPRVMAANRLSKNGRSWVYMVGKYNSGTGNKHWMHIQTKKNQMAFWVLEQTPQKVISKDETDLLYEQGYWISCGIPYFKENEIKINSAEIQEQSAGNIPLKNIVEVLENGQGNVTDIPSLLNLMRGPELALAGRTDLYEEIKQQATGSRSNPPPHLATNNKQSKIINALKDSKAHLETVLLKNIQRNNQTNQKYVQYYEPNPNHMRDFILKYNSTWLRLFNLKNEVDITKSQKGNNKDRYVLTENGRLGNSNSGKTSPLKTIKGVIDLKLTKNNQKFLAAAGPPFNIQNKIRAIEPFQWSKSSIKYLPHDGHSDIWNYAPIEANFVWN